MPTPPDATPAPAEDDYTARLREQVEQFRHVENVHDLPAIHHYWRDAHLKPLWRRLFGGEIITDFYVKFIRDAASETGALGRETVRVTSLGAGDCAMEVKTAQGLRAAGLDRVVIECVELADHAIERGRAAAAAAGVTDMLRFTQADVNRWRPEQTSHAVMAHHSLHHFVALEDIFHQVKAALTPGGLFITNDMIGRNGHMRWPEALLLIDCMWANLDDARKYDRQLQRFDAQYRNVDCSDEGFEGVRAQDILPCLLERLHMRVFAAYGGLVDPFIGRQFGHNFDPADPADTTFIDTVQRASDLLIDLGVLTPTGMYAVMSASPGQEVYYRWRPERCIRDPDRTLPDIHRTDE